MGETECGITPQRAGVCHPRRGSWQTRRTLATGALGTRLAPGQHPGLVVFVCQGQALKSAGGLSGR